MTTIKENAEAQTTAKRTGLTNAMPGDRESIEGATYFAAGNAAVGNGAHQRQPLPMHALVIIQAEPMDIGPVGGPANWECDADMIQLADNSRPAMIFQKTTTPHGRILPNGTQFFEFVMASGSEEAQEEVLHHIPIGQLLTLADDAIVLKLSEGESEIVHQLIQFQKGKSDAKLKMKPLHDAQRAISITPAKGITYNKVFRLRHAMGAKHFNDIYARADEAMSTESEFVTIGQFTEANLDGQINKLLRETYDSSFTNDGFQFSSIGSAAFAQLEFGSNLKQISTGVIIKKDNLVFGVPPALLAQRIVNMNFVFDIMGAMFDEYFVDLLKETVREVIDNIKPQTAQQFTMIVDSLFYIAGSPPPEDVTSKEKYQGYLRTVLDTSNANPRMVKYKNEVAEKALADQAAATTELSAKIKQAAKAAKTQPKPPKTPTNNKRPTSDQDRQKMQENLVKSTTEYAKSRPVPKPSIGTKDLCPRVAQGVVCGKQVKGICNEFEHAKKAWMTPDYIRWAKDQPTWTVINAKKAKVVG